MRILCFQAKDKHGISALLAAIWEGHTDCVKLLLEWVSQPLDLLPEHVSHKENSLPCLQIIIWKF
jgi:ankyrin repeat protein